MDLQIQGAETDPMVLLPRSFGALISDDVEGGQEHTADIFGELPDAEKERKKGWVLEFALHLQGKVTDPFELIWRWRLRYLPARDGSGLACAALASGGTRSRAARCGKEHGTAKTCRLESERCRLGLGLVPTASGFRSGPEKDIAGFFR